MGASLLALAKSIYYQVILYLLSQLKFSFGHLKINYLIIYGN